MESAIQESKQVFSSLSSPYKEFYEFHGVQLIGINFPPSPQKVCELYDILTKQVFDSGDYFQLLENQANDTFEVKAQKPLQPNEKIFLIDHAISFRYPDLRKALASNPNVTERLLYMLKFWDSKKPLGPASKPVSHPLAVEYEYLEIIDPLKQEVPKDCVTLSFYGNNISEIELVDKLCENLPSLKALWVNENPVSEDANLLELIETKFHNIEIFNSKLTRNAGKWAINYLIADGNLSKTQENNENARIINFSDRDIFRLKSYEFLKAFPRVRKLDLRGHQLDSLENTNKFFNLLGQFPKLKEILVDESISDVFFELFEAKKLCNISKSLEKVNGYYLQYGKPSSNQQDIEYILRNVWKISNCYRLANSEQLDESSIWYVMDEFGTGVQHSDTPNVAVVPFLFAPNNKFDSNMISYSIMWPIKELKAGHNAYRDYLFGLDESRNRSAKLAVWLDVPYDVFRAQYEKYRENIEEITKKGEIFLKEKDVEFKAKKNLSQTEPEGILPSTRPLKVITDLEMVTKNLHSGSFCFTTKLEEANIVFLGASIKDNFWDLSAEKYVNQFPFESCIVMKNNLANTVTESLGYVKWLQHTYDLQSNLHEFMGEYKENKEKLRNNLWIIKPPNMARSMDMVVTDSIDVILRLLETGPKLAQKYIHRPVTFRGKKIDLRFIVLLRSIQPLEVFLYKVFWIRTSNNNFSLDPRSLEIYETHFTVMNYGHALTQIHYYDFIPEFNEENKHRNVAWDQVYEKIKDMVKELFVGVEKKYPEMHAKNARSVYGMDVMIDAADFQPKLLEMTFSPDCNRACKYHPSFYDDVFSCLYLHRDDCNVERVV